VLPEIPQMPLTPDADGTLFFIGQLPYEVPPFGQLFWFARMITER